MALSTNKYQVGNSATALNNFVIETPAVPDGTLTVRRGTLSVPGTTVFSVDSNGLFLPTNRLTLATAQSTTSGTTKTFDNLPSWVKRWTLSFSGLSTNSSANALVRLGTISGVDATGYLGSTAVIPNAGAITSSASTAGVLIYANTTNILHGTLTGTLLDPLTNLWALSLNLGYSNSGITSNGGYTKVLSGSLSQIVLITSDGTSLFDSGSVNIMYEG